VPVLALPVGQRKNNAHLGGAPGAPKCAKVPKLNMDYDPEVQGYKIREKHE
jgi:hypothetical protein